MKTLFVSLAALLFAFFLGCQSSITDPEVPENQNYLSTPVDDNVAYKDVISTLPGVINLSGMLFDPSHRLNSFAEIGGVVKYKIESAKSDITSPNHEMWKYVTIYVDAKLKVNCPCNHKVWTVNAFANAVITNSPGSENINEIEKSFRVCNTCCAPLLLIVKFRVDGNDLGLVSMKLQKPAGWTCIGQPEM